MDHRCPYGNRTDILGYYDFPTRSAVIIRGTALDIQHETCHAHQHYTIQQALGHDGIDLGLSEWYSTAEGQAWLTRVTTPQPWGVTGFNASEDFAESCAHFLLGSLGDPVRAAVLQELLGR